MNAFSFSLFNNSIPHQKLLQCSTPSPKNIPLLRVSSVSIEEKSPKNSTPTPTVYKPQRTTPTPAAAAATTKSSSAAANALKEKKYATGSKIKILPQPSFQATFCSVFDDIINKFIDPPNRPFVDPKYVLANNFAPVEELPPTECPIIEGELPPCLDGAYIRNGPNPQYLPRGPYHLFDGDGMLHSLRISQGRATFCSRYVKTYKFNLEHDAGFPILPNVFSGFYNLAGAATRGAITATRALAGQFNPLGGVGLANTSIVFFGNELYALGESDLPYAVRLTPEGDIETLGRSDFNGKLSMAMTAHPKVDPETGEVFAFRYGPVPPFLTLFRFDAGGSKQPDVPIFSMMQPTFLHDFAITSRYAIIPDIQVVVKPLDMIVGGKSPVGSDPNKVPRIGVIPRDATNESDIRWFKVPGFNAMHTINAWEEDGEDAIVLVAPNILSIEHALEHLELVHCTVEMVRIDLKSGIVTRRTLSSRNLDFGVINPAYVGKKNRYAYMGVGDPMPKISGVVKLDFNGGKKAVRHFGPGCFGGEPFFVAKEPDNEEADEDDGYVVSYVHNEQTGESTFVVMDAQSPTLDIVASVKLPRRVPYGFHGLFVSERDLQNQLSFHASQPI